MSWDIYGEPLRRGHCEVHPHVHEEYPCSVCIADKRSSEQQGGCRGGCESEHLLSLQREHIVHLEQERDAMAAHVEFCHKVLSMIENGPTYLVARQYRALRMARERKPETSLTRLKAQWQADALDKLADKLKWGVVVDHIREEAAKLRQQAEGGET